MMVCRYLVHMINIYVHMINMIREQRKICFSYVICMLILCLRYVWDMSSYVVNVWEMFSFKNELRDLKFGPGMQNHRLYKMLGVDFWFWDFFFGKRQNVVKFWPKKEIFYQKWPFFGKKAKNQKSAPNIL